MKFMTPLWMFRGQIGFHQNLYVVMSTCVLGKTVLRKIVRVSHHNGEAVYDTSIKREETEE